jgi:hypothetical protein
MSSAQISEAEMKVYPARMEWNPKGFPQRIVKTEGFERLFSHYTGLHGDELMEYVKDFQDKAFKVYFRNLIAYIRFVRTHVFGMAGSPLYEKVLMKNIPW